MAETPLETNAIFGTPAWRHPVPEMLPYHSGIKAEPEKLWAAGYFGKHGSGYGYQTNGDWVEGPWHNHHPATLSGCYYLPVPQTRNPGEGLLMFQRPEPANTFCENMAAVRPREGHLTIFRSHLMHRPMPTPTARAWRINICMDAFVHWHKRFEDPLASLDTREDFDEALARSRQRP